MAKNPANHNNYWSNEDIVQLFYLREDREFNWDKIARRMGRTKNSVQTKYSVLKNTNPHIVKVTGKEPIDEQLHLEFEETPVVAEERVISHPDDEDDYYVEVCIRGTKLRLGPGEAISCKSFNVRVYSNEDTL